MKKIRKIYLRLRYPKMDYWTMCPVCSTEFAGKTPAFKGRPSKAEWLEIDEHIYSCQQDR